MSIGRAKSRVVAFRQAAQAEVEEAVPTEVAASPLYGVAMLKIAMELKRADAAPLDELISGVLSRMNLPEEQFRTYLAANGGLLRTIASRRRY